MTKGVELRFMDSKACLSVLISRLVSYCSLFFGSILAPAHSPQGPSPVLAEDSEGEG